MRPIIRSLAILTGLLVCFTAFSQSLLPDFAARELTRGKIQISWNNPYRNCVQLAIQRSLDSSKNFRTIFSSQSPELASNGYVDNRPVSGVKNFYRIFYSLEGGTYFFTRAIAVEASAAASSLPVIIPSTPVINASPVAPIPTTAEKKNLTSIYLQKHILFRFDKAGYARFKDSINTKTKDKLRRLNERSVEWIPVNKEVYYIYKDQQVVAALTKKSFLQWKDSIKHKTRDTLYALDPYHSQIRSFAPPPKAYVFIYRNDSLLQVLETALYRKFKDSVATKTKDTLYASDDQHVEIRPFVPRYVWKPSDYIFTNNKGYVTILLPLVKQHKYSVVFYEEDGSELFRIKNLKEQELILDKTDFVHAGWFYFELFEDDKLMEKNKFFLPR
ncbi:MAG TPA: hypothetical protein VGE25_11945 [Sediminibacterium sp.]